MTSSILHSSDVSKLVSRLVSSGTRVIAPVPAGQYWEETEYQPIQRLEDATLAGPLPSRSLKEFFRPSPQVKGPFAPQVILGARPCDTAGVENLGQVMGTDYGDRLWLARREATTIVSVACPGADDSCFCSAVGLGPDATKGADAVLVPLDGSPGPDPSKRKITENLRRYVDVFLHDMEPFPGAADLQALDAPPISEPVSTVRYLARAVTAKGESILDGCGVPLDDPGDVEKAERFSRIARQKVSKNLAPLRLSSARLERTLEAQLGLLAADGGELLPEARALLTAEQRAGLGGLSDWLAKNFDHPAMKAIAARCHGCGRCQAVCSTSPCFDVVDEPRKRTREPDWREGDLAEVVMLPRRDARGARNECIRQRVMHKFSMFPRRFDSILCTGCGRCTRGCEAGLKLPEVLGQLVHLASTEAEASTP